MDKTSTFSLVTCWLLLVLGFLAGVYPFATTTPWITYLVGNIAVVFCLIHCSIWAGWSGALKIFGITFLAGFVAEILGVHYGFLFGPYHYAQELNGPLVLGVPPLTMVDYFAIGYPCFIMGRAVVGGLSKKIIGLRLIGVAVFAALAMTAHDLSTDPAQSTVLGLWVWEEGGAYFGVPLHNFIGWFFVTFFFLLLLGVITKQEDEMRHISTYRSPSFFLPAILLYLTFEVPTMLRPVISGETPIRLALSGVAMFATTIPVLAAILALYRDASPISSERLPVK